MPTAPTQTPTRTAVPTQSRQAKLPHVHPWLRWPLRIYGVLITFVVLALLGNIAVVPLAQGTKDWPAAALGQVAALLTWAQGHQVQTVAGAVVLAALFGLSLVANHEITREQQTAADARSSAVAADAAAAQIDQQLANVAQQVANVMQGQLTGDIERAVAAAQRASAAAPAVPAGVVSPSGLPRPASLVGRERPLADLMAGLRAGDTIGVFAVEGLAGVGKTALAAEAVAQLSLDRVAFPGGAAWISCEGLTGAEGLADLWARVARALGAEAVAALPDPQERRAALRAALADPARPRLLLALDNVEPGLNAGMVLDTLAGGCATLLLTSRGVVAPERLQAFPLEPLADPAAVQLFAQRLRQADPARPTPDDTLAVPRLAGLLGGLPLAIELAAAYAGIQRRTLDAIAAEVEHDGLAGGALRGVRPRFERSWQVLTETQQRLFAGLSILEGASFPRDAALAMAHAAAVDPGTAEPDERAAADLDALIGLALVEPQAGGRLRLHPLLREYAAAKLWATPVNAAAEHLGEAAVAYWLAYAEAHPSYAGMDALEVEATGIMGALTWAHDHARHRDVLALAHALNQFWFVRGRIDDARIGWPWALEAAQTLDDVREQRFMLHGLAVLAADAGRADEARAGYEAALALARQLGDPAAQSTELQTMGALDVDTMQQWERARTELGEALALARQVQQPALIVEAVWWLAELDRRAGRREDACAGFRAALEIYTRLGSPDAEITRQRLRELGCDG